MLHPKLKPIFQKRVKHKKRHEIELMAQLCHQSCQNCKVDFVIDFGAGLGHLARVLNYGYNIQVCCLEKEEKLNRQAIELNHKIETTFQRYHNHLHIETPAFSKSNQRPFHLTLTIDSKLTVDKFLKLLKECILEQNDNNPEAFKSGTNNRLQNNEKNQQFPFTFGIVGLHPCGDLAAILISLFLRIPQARFLHLVGCCYMKLTTNALPTQKVVKNQSMKSLLPSNGYPLSDYLNRSVQQVGLSFEAREVACHAIEMYYDRLNRKDYEFLKIHSFRAATERILVNRYPQLKHIGLRNVRHVPGLDFKEYFQRAIADLDIPSFTTEDLCQTITQQDLKRWKELVIFYSLRLFFAPLIESVILYDRILYLMENGKK